MTDNQLRERIKDTSENWAEIIYDEYYNYVYTIVFNKLRSCASDEDIEDCIADVFTEIISSYNIEGSYSGDLKAYVSRIAKNRAVNMFKKLTCKKKHISDVEKIELIEAENSDIAVNFEKTQIQNIVLDEIEKLGEPDSTIILQKYYYNNSSKEIAEILSLSSAAVRKRCSRAVKILQSRLHKLGVC